MSAEPMTTKVYPVVPTDENTLQYVPGSPHRELRDFIRKHAAERNAAVNDRLCFIKGIFDVNAKGDIVMNGPITARFVDELDSIRDRFGSLQIEALKIYLLAPKAAKPVDPKMMAKRALVFPLGVWGPMGDWRVEGNVRIYSSHVQLNAVNFIWSNFNKTPINMKLADFVPEGEFPSIPAEILARNINDAEHGLQNVFKPAMASVHPPNPAECGQDRAKLEETVTALVREYLARQVETAQYLAPRIPSTANPILMPYEPIPEFMYNAECAEPANLGKTVLEVNKHIGRLAANATGKEAKRYGRMAVLAWEMFNDDPLTGKRSIAHGCPIPLGQVSSTLVSCMLSDRKERRLGTNILVQAILYLLRILTDPEFSRLFRAIGRFALISETAVHTVDGSYYVPDRFYGTLSLGNSIGPVQAIQMLDENGVKVTEEFNAMGHGYAIARAVVVDPFVPNDDTEIMFYRGLCGLEGPAIDPVSGEVDSAAVSHAITTLIRRLFTPAK